VGVAGIHRLLAHLKTLREARVLIVIAGMEGAFAERGGRAGGGSDCCCADFGWIRRKFWGAGGIAGNVERVRAGGGCGQYRQWFWSCVPGGFDFELGFGSCEGISHASVHLRSSGSDLS
jgi:hypothetical protein